MLHQKDRNYDIKKGREDAAKDTVLQVVNYKNYKYLGISPHTTETVFAFLITQESFHIQNKNSLCKWYGTTQVKMAYAEDDKHAQCAQVPLINITVDKIR